MKTSCRSERDALRRYRGGLWFQSLCARGLLWGGTAAVLMWVGPAFAGVGHGVRLAPHVAVYDVTLVRASPGSGIGGLSGRMVYELSGSACEGYTQNMRFVTKIADREGAEQINDLPSSSWEAAKGNQLRFSLSQYRNKTLTDSTEGDADRAKPGGPIKVELTRPSRKDLRLKPGVYFPMQHSIALIQSALAGERMFVANVYDGSDKGDKVFLTSAYIGSKVPSRADDLPKKSAKDSRIAGQYVWPVSIGYFDPGSEKRDAVPSYELSFRFFENGVSTNLLIDYGDFAVRGSMRDLKFLPATKCEEAEQ